MTLGGGEARSPRDSSRTHNERQSVARPDRGKSHGKVRASEKDPAAVQMPEDEKRVEGRISSPMVPDGPATLLENPQSGISPELNLQGMELEPMQDAPAVGLAVTMTGRTPPDCPTAAFQDLRMIGINSNSGPASISGTNADWNFNVGTAAVQNESAGQSEKNVVSKISGSVDSPRVSPIATARHESQPTPVPSNMEQVPPTPAKPFSGGSEMAVLAAPQDKEQSAQLNFQFIAAKASESGAAIANQSALASEMLNRGFADSLEAIGTEEAGNKMASTSTGGKPLNPLQLFLENGDSAYVSAAQGQAADRAGLWMSMQGKQEHGQANPGEPRFFSEERPSQARIFIASNPLQNGEPAGAFSVSNAALPTAQTPASILQLAEQVGIQLRAGKGEIRIQLKPDGFGRLEIRAENTMHGISARISTESGAVKSYLENNLQLLQQTLQDQGLKIDRIQIIVQDASDSQSSSGFTSQFGNAGAGQNGRDSEFSAGKTDKNSVHPANDGITDAASWLARNPDNRFYTVA